MRSCPCVIKRGAICHPDDVRAVAHDVLRHRIIPSFEAEAKGYTSDTLLDQLIEKVPVA